jgi:uncharacterized membrane protein
MGASLYRATLGDILVPAVRLAPAIAFYLLFPIGVVAFAVMPAFRSVSTAQAAIYGGHLLGLVTYGT